MMGQGGKISRSWSLIKASWSVMRQDREILIFPLLSGLSSMLIMASFMLFLFKTGQVEMMDETRQPSLQSYGFLFVFYLVNYFSMTFFSVALIACASIRLTGQDPTAGDGFEYAMKRVKYIFGWAMMEATVGLLLQMLQNRSQRLGQWVIALIGMSWTLATYLVVPVFVMEERGPIDALKRSAELFKKTWGEQMVGSFTFGAVSTIFCIPGFALIVGAMIFLKPESAQTSLAYAFLAAAVIYFVVLTIVGGALKGVFQAALYFYARDGKTPAGFNPDDIAGSFQAK